MRKAIQVAGRYLAGFLAIFTGAKSFKDNPVLGNRLLNRLGLHVFRLLFAHGIMAVRMRLLSRGVSRQDRQHYFRQGYLLKPQFLPDDLFQQLEQQVRAYRGEVRACRQGDTENHRILLKPETVAQLPAVQQLFANQEFCRLLQFTAGHKRLPLSHIELLRNGFCENNRPDPQKNLHTDTFQPTMKFWLFLDDVDDHNSPFTYVPGSNRLNYKRLRWEYALSQRAKHHPDSYSARGSFRFQPKDLAALGLNNTKAFKVPKNTLLIANTFGIHGRGQAKTHSTRLSLWGMSRTNPFIPFTGLGGRWANQAQYALLEWLRKRDDQRAQALGNRAPWHKIE